MEVHSANLNGTQSTSLPPKNRNNIEFIAIHLGARDSNYDERSGQDSSAIAEQICKTVMSNTNIGCAIDAVVQLVRMLEDNPKFNCGNGSNLTIRGEVECDASIMCGKTRSWASVGAVSGCKNPIALAKNLFDKRNTPIPLGLVPPNFLVGSGANLWMKEECSSLAVHSSRLISAQALAKYQRLKSRYDSAKRSRESNIDSPSSSTNIQSTSGDMIVDQELDTVGAIAIDVDGNFATAVSSGGLWLKQKGRVGQAAVPGAGCWCGKSVAVATTGTGEYISSNVLAKTFHDKLEEAKNFNDNNPDKSLTEIISTVTTQCYQELQAWSVLSQIQAERLPVALVAVCDVNNAISDCDKIKPDHEIICSVAHNTKSLIVVHMHRDQDNPVTQISFLKGAEIASKSVILNITHLSGLTTPAGVVTTKTERQVLSISQPVR